MLSSRELDAYLHRLGLGGEAGALIRLVRESDPARSVGVNALTNMRCRIASVKMGHTVSVESRTCELPFGIRQELDESVLEYWAQPCTVRIERQINGKLHASNYTPDFLVLSQLGAVIVECKPIEAAQNLCVEKPTDWSFHDGQFRFGPAAEEFARIGIPFNVWPAPSRAAILNSNLETLLALSYCKTPPSADSLFARAKILLDRHPMTISDLCASVRGLDESIVMHWVATKQFFACLASQLLSRGLTTYVYTNKGDADAREELLLLAAASQTSAEVDASPILRATAIDLANARDRWSNLQDVLAGRRSATRNERRYLGPVRDAIATDRNPLEQLLTSTAKRGNRKSRIPKQEDRVSVIIERMLKNGEKLSPTVVLARVNPLLRDVKLTEIGYESVRIRCNRIPKEAAARAFAGNRAYHQARPRTDPLEATLRTEIPGLIAHVDSSKWDQRLWERLPWSNQLPCPWWYVAYDEASDRSIGVSLAFGKSDRFALSLLVRDIGQTIGFLPHYLVADRGSENGSIWWQMLEAHTQMHALDRATGNPRSGSTVENGIGIAQKQFSQRLLGNTELDKAGRKADGNKKSKAHTCYSLALVDEGLRSYLSSHYNSTPHGEREDDPNGIWNAGRAKYPLIGRPIPPTDDWDILTAIPVRNKVKVDINKGIRTYWRSYTSSELIANIRKQPRPDDLRLSAATPSIMYAKFGSSWVKAYSSDFLTQRSLPAGHQSAELMVRRLIASSNKHERRGANERLDARIDELNRTAKATKAEEKENKVSPACAAKNDAFDDIRWE